MVEDCPTKAPEALERKGDLSLGPSAAGNRGTHIKQRYGQHAAVLEPHPKTIFCNAHRLCRRALRGTGSREIEQTHGAYGPCALPATSEVTNSVLSTATRLVSARRLPLGLEAKGPTADRNSVRQDEL